MSSPALDVRDLTITTGHGPSAATVVDGVDLRIERGQGVGLVGASGSGKTVTILACLGLLPAGLALARGRVTLLDHDVPALRPDALRALVGARVGYVPQDPLAALDPMFTVGDQITARDRLHGHGRGRGAAAREAMRGLGLARTPGRSLAMAAEMLDGVGVSSPLARARQHPAAFSGGMRQRALIAAAMRPRPDLVIADEPTTGLDASLERQVLDLIAADVRSHACSLLLVSDDLNLIAWYCDVAYVMHRGRVVESGPPEALFRRPRHAYTRELFAASPALALRPRGVSVARRGVGPPATGEPGPPAPAPGHDLLRLEDVTRRYGSGTGAVTALDAVSLAVAPGEFVSLVGESGSGKSSLVRLALALERPDAGHVLFAGQDLAKLAGRDVRGLRRRFQPVFQDPLSSLNPQWTVARSVTHPLRVHGLCGWPSEAAALAALLAEVDLAFAASRYPHQLSGGQRQRVCIARALATRPDLVIADEALSGLDVPNQRAVLAIFRAMRDRHGTAFLFVSHDLRTVRDVSDRVYVMSAGRIVESAPPDALFEAPRHSYTRGLLASLLPPRFADPAPAAVATP